MTTVPHDWVLDWLMGMMVLLPLYWLVGQTLHLLIRPLRTRKMWLVFLESVAVSLLLCTLLIHFRPLALSLAWFGAGAFLARLGVGVAVELAVHYGNGPAVLKRAGYHILRAAAGGGTALVVFSNFQVAMTTAIFAIPLAIVMACDFVYWFLSPRYLRGSFAAVSLESAITILLCLGFWFTLGSHAARISLIVIAFVLRLAIAAASRYLSIHRHRRLTIADGAFVLGRSLVYALGIAAVLELA